MPAAALYTDDIQAKELPSRNELRFIRQTQRLEDVGAKLIAISTQYKAPDESVDDSFYQTTKYTTDGMLNEEIAGKSL